MKTDPHAAEFEELIAQPMRDRLEKYITAFKRHRAERTPEAMSEFDRACHEYYASVFKNTASPGPCPVCMENHLNYEKSLVK